MKRNSKFAAALFLLAAMASSCGGLQKQVSVNEATQNNVLVLKASNFKFEPNNIRVSQGDRVTFRIENTSGTLHDFTLKDPGGNTIQDIDLPPKQTTTVPVTFFKTAGIYKFYCDKDMHASLGMRGQVEAVKK